MRHSKFVYATLFVLTCLFVNSSADTAVRMANSVSMPSGQEFFTYLPSDSPSTSTEPRLAKPLGIGSVASGGGTFNLQASLADFQSKVDIYIALYAPTLDPQNFYLITPGNGVQRLQDGVIPWRSGTFGNIANETIFSFPASSLPLGFYTAYFLVIPSGLPITASVPFYLWETSFTIDNSPIGSEYVVFAWNDLGMHCLNPSYDQAVILPPYNNLWAQVVKRGSVPQIVTDGLTVEYRILNNSFSYGKGLYGQFWDNVVKLFGTELERNKGLNLTDPAIHNGLAGQMAPKAEHFQADGIPVTPVDDSGNYNPYQVAVVTVKNSAGTIVAQTRATVPVSDEIDCAKCHGQNPFLDLLQRHDSKHHTSLVSEMPVLCANCHGSPALGSLDKGRSGRFLSDVIHSSHATRGAECLDCHPGRVTKCSRSLAHTAPDGNCMTCHGTMSDVGGTVKSGSRIPWVDEPKCATCHGGVAEVDTGSTLYRKAKGHGEVHCAGCHGSPHAMIPTSQPSDNYQAIRYQGSAKTIGSCGACHSRSRGLEGEIGEFAETHGGSNPERRTACNVCHTAVSADTPQWPHAYQWRAR